MSAKVHEDPSDDGPTHPLNEFNTLNRAMAYGPLAWVEPRKAFLKLAFGSDTLPIFPLSVTHPVTTMKASMMIFINENRFMPCTPILGKKV